jgi:EF-P beta-lysylation protein EpmB
MAVSLKNKTFTTIDTLLDFLEFSEHNRALVWRRPRFPLMVPRRLAEKMGKNDPTCPLFLQFVPLLEETASLESFSLEPVNDPLFRLGPKYLQKYAGRSLILTTKACAMHCRYCFRQNFPYETTTGGFSQELDLIKKNTTLHEVILSGGDPLSLKNSALIPLLLELDTINHLQIIRFHTRTLIADPDRLDVELLSCLAQLKKNIIFVVHVNHPLELGEDLTKAFDRLKELKIILLSQSVLLKGVNDDVCTLEKLSFDLFRSGVLPYYLHQLDRVQGASHFEVPIEKGLELVEQLRERLPGYLVPRYVQEIPNQPSKTPLVREAVR